ncbi:prephenate dehydratase [Verrucomicrobiota bacterium]
MSVPEIIYLGPEGTYSSQVAQKRYKRNRVAYKCFSTVREICEYVAAKPSRKGVVPIENSSSGYIYQTVDALLDEAMSLEIEEEISVNVKLALLGRKGKEIKRIYSHEAPLKHCEQWLKKKYPKAERIPVNSTATAASHASENSQSAAISSRSTAAIYDLDVLRCPIPPGSKLPNVTDFFVISRKCLSFPRKKKTSLGVRLLNKPGALCDFLIPFKDAGLNLSRIVSRPASGIPRRPMEREYAFFIDVNESMEKPILKSVLAKAGKHAAVIRKLGSYPSHRVYHSL